MIIHHLFFIRGIICVADIFDNNVTIISLKRIKRKIWYVTSLYHVPRSWYSRKIEKKSIGNTISTSTSVSTNIWNIFTSKYMLFTGREVRIGKNCAQGLEYGPRPQAEDRAQDRGHSFSLHGPT